MKNILYLIIYFISTSFSLIAGCLETIEKTLDTGQFYFSTDGTVVDNKTRLMWTACSLGQVYNKRQCEGEISKVSWSKALSLAKQSKTGNYSDWRLPNKNEINSIIELSCNMPSIDVVVFPSTGIGSYWSSSPYDDVETTIWVADFATGNIFAAEPSMELMVRLVRNI